MNKSNLYLDIHALQVLPPSCVNRDDTGAPKTAIYGGTLRSRVSSQAWKRAVRNEFKTIFPEQDLGKRTRFVVKMISDKIQEKNPSWPEEKAKKMAENALKEAGIKLKSDASAEALTFISDAQAEALAELAAAGSKEKSEYKKALSENPSVDIALFGRMVASDPSLNSDACCQVSHSISTHGIENEFDYFTAVDDLGPDDSAGAGHIGNSEFNSSTIYRYATINVKELHNLLGHSAPSAAAGFLKAFTLSMPTGKQNSYANRTVPSLLYVTIRTDQPVSLASAFEEPVKAGENGFTKKSISALEKQAGFVYENFVQDPEKAYFVGEDGVQLGQRKTLSEVLAAVEEDLSHLLKEE